MNPDSLRTDVLRCVAEHEATGSAAYLNDAEIAATINVELADVQRQMVILESSELLQLSKTFGPTYAARLTPNGMLAIEQLTPGDGPNRPMGF